MSSQNKPQHLSPTHTFEKRSTYSFLSEEIDHFARKTMQWAEKRFEEIVFLNSNTFMKDPYHKYEQIIAVGKKYDYQTTDYNDDAFGKLEEYLNTAKDWNFGYLSYESNHHNIFKNHNLKHKHDGIQFPVMYFFCPQIVFLLKKKEVSIEYHTNDFSFEEIKIACKEIDNELINNIDQCRNEDEIQDRTSKEEYLNAVSEIKKHIQRGDIYEMNYCIEFFLQQYKDCPLNTYYRLMKENPSPFSCFVKHKEKFLLSSSPERYINKCGDKIISQPIKGTIKRGKTPDEDNKLKKSLLKSKKEKMENVMIVDLVRNDLSTIAEKGTVQVEELFGLYTYPHVHQMISTISCKLNPEYAVTDLIKKTFPMGSMTGAPKISAMSIADRLEKTRRGLFSGSVGYITPEKDADMNVIIRSILLNRESGYASIMAGSAITIESDPEYEYQECLLKSEILKRVIKNEFSEMNNKVQNPPANKPFSK